MRLECDMGRRQLKGPDTVHAYASFVITTNSTIAQSPAGVQPAARLWSINLLLRFPVAFA